MAIATARVNPAATGPYDYASGPVGPPPHPWAQSAYHEQSEICGLCHNVTTPDTDAGPLKTLIDASGTDTGIPFPIERTFSEWQRSDFADVIFRDGLGDPLSSIPALAHSLQCQDCHMPNSTDPTAAACFQEGAGARSGNLMTHVFVGGNTWVPSILRGQFGDALSRTAAYTQTVAAAQQVLQGAAQVGITTGAFSAPTASTAGTLALTVRVTNLAGHKLPTGYSEGRRMWLNLRIRDASNVLIGESGAYDATSGVLTEDPQARIYEILQGIWDAGSGTCRTNDAADNLQFHFVLNNCIAKDNRVPPLGFSGGADPEIRPKGLVYPPVGADGAHLANYDDAAYSFSVPAATALPLSISATLYYQTASKQYIEFLSNQAQTNAFAGENAMCSGGPGRPFTVGAAGAQSWRVYLSTLEQCAR